MRLHSLGVAMHKESLRDGFGRGLLRAGKENSQVVALCADVTGSIKMDAFAKEFPERFVQVGVAEQNLVTVASGLASQGKIPFAGAYAVFSPGRNWEQIRTTICLNNQPVKIVGSHAGLNVGPDGATHQMLEDIALMRSLPNMVVLAPGDSLEAEKAVLAMTRDTRPNYLRLTREASPIFTNQEAPFEIGKAQRLFEGGDISVFATGTMSYVALQAARELASENIWCDVVHFATIKPLDEAAVFESLRRTGRCITIEEGQIAGGFGSAVTETVAESYPLPLKRLGVRDTFGESGSSEELLQRHRLDVQAVKDDIRAWVQGQPQYHR